MASTTGTTAKNFTTFHLFPKLPIELRIRIWKISIKPRYVRIAWDAASQRVTSPHLPPILLISREARNEGLKAYQKCFNPKNESAAVYFNYEIDTLYLNWSSFHDRRVPFTDSPSPLRSIVENVRFRLGAEDCSKIQKLLLDRHDLTNHIFNGWNNGGQAPNVFTGIKNMAIIYSSIADHNLRGLDIERFEFILRVLEKKMDDKLRSHMNWDNLLEGPDDTNDYNSGLRVYRHWRFAGLAISTKPPSKDPRGAEFRDWFLGSRSIHIDYAQTLPEGRAYFHQNVWKGGITIRHDVQIL